MDADRSALRGRQIDRLRRLLTEALPGNRFYARKFADAGIRPDDLRAADDLARLPFTTKAELAADQAEHPPYGTALTYPLERYCRLHQTSGTSTGRPLRWLDTPGELGVAARLLAGQLPGDGPDARGDRVFFPFSFGPFLGFWTRVRGGHPVRLPVSARRRHDQHRPAALPARTRGPRSSSPRRPTPCTWPSWPPRRGSTWPARPCGRSSSPASRAATSRRRAQRIEEVWGARVFDHYGMTEVGPVAIECEADPGAMLRRWSRSTSPRCSTRTATARPRRRGRRTGA